MAASRMPYMHEAEVGCRFDVNSLISQVRIMPLSEHWPTNHESAKPYGPYP